MKNIFEIDNFNIIQDSENYYFFRALNRADNKDLEDGIILDDNGKIKRIRTDRERYTENPENGIPKYDKDDEISIEQMHDHIKMQHRTDTNCISLSTDANVIINYGRGYYKDKYIMVKVPKKEIGQKVKNAGKYLLEEIEKKVNVYIDKLNVNDEEDAEILRKVEKIENANTIAEIREIIKKTYKGEIYTSISGIKQGIQYKRPYERLSSYQTLNKEQNLEKNKVVGKLTLLENKKGLEIIPLVSNNKLLETVGNAFSSMELIHYKDIPGEIVTEIPSKIMDMFSLIQQINDEKIPNTYEIKNELVKYISKGMTFSLPEDSVFNRNDTLKDNITIEEMYNLTNGRVEYVNANSIIKNVFYLAKSQARARELANILNQITGNKPQYTEIIKYINENGFEIEPEAITRHTNIGYQISEAVNLNIKKNEESLINDIKQLSNEELIEIMEKGGLSDTRSIITNTFSSIKRDKPISKHDYYAEAIVDGLDMAKIYRKSNRDKSLTQLERQNLLNKLKEVDCIKLVKAFTNAGINEKDVSGYIINLLASNGYKGYTLEELSKLDNLNEIIDLNVKNTNLRGHVFASVMEDLRNIKDDANKVEGSSIELHDYQQEAIYNIDRILAEGKRFAGVVMPTGAGKSFVAMTKMLHNKNGNIIYVAPQHTILNQLQKHILKNIAQVSVLSDKEIEKLKQEQNELDERKLKLPTKRILPNQVSEYVKKEFPHLKMFCYKGLSSKEDNYTTEEIKKEENNLKEILKIADADLIVLDELHRSGANTWKPVVKQLIETNQNANVLGMTATPIRDVDHVDMMKEIAKMTKNYNHDELLYKQYLASEMYLVDAIQRGLVVEPEIVSFNFTLKHTDEYQEIIKMIQNEKNGYRRTQLLETKAEIDRLISEDSNVSESIKRNLSQKEMKDVGKIIKETIRKKDGKYIVFIPQNRSEQGLSEKQYFEQQEQKIKNMIKEIDEEPEIFKISSTSTKIENAKSINQFQNSNSEHLKMMLAVDMLNEGVHIDGINGEIMLRKIGNGNTILYFQQLGRVVYAINQNDKEPILDKEAPIVWDVYNNFLAQSLNRTINHTTPRSDLEKLTDIIKWMDKHGYEPDINSEDAKEARKAIILKKIQQKYKKYTSGINNPRLSKTDIYEIKQIIELANSIDLFDMEIGNRIIPPGEKDLGEVQLFKITATQKKFSELYKKINKIKGNKERYKENKRARLSDAMNVLGIIAEHDIFIDNSLIKYTDTLIDVLNRCPKDIKEILLEELYNYETDYPLGKEYNYAKTSFRDRGIRNYFNNADLRELNACGIFEKIDLKYLQDNYSEEEIRILNQDVLKNDFIVFGPQALLNLNIKTLTYFDENGYRIPTKEDIRKDTIINDLRIALDSIPNGYTFANESLKELPDITIRQLIVNYKRKEVVDLNKLGVSISKKSIIEEIEFLRDYYNNNQFAKISDVFEYKKLGILPLKLNDNNIDEDTNLKREDFGKTLQDLDKDIVTYQQKEYIEDVKNVLISLRDNYGISVVNEDINNIPYSNICYYVSHIYVNLKGKNVKSYMGLPQTFDIRIKIKKAREYLEQQEENLTLEDIIEYKKLGILPLKLNENGIDIETNMKKSEFGKTIEDVEKQIKFKYLKEVLTLANQMDGISTANEDIGKFKNNYNYLDIKKYVEYVHSKIERYRYTSGLLPASFNFIKEIKEAREYLKEQEEDLTLEDIIEYKKLGILPLKLDENGIDIETNMKKSEFGKTMEDTQQEIDLQEEKKVLNKLKRVLTTIRKDYKICLVNENLDSLPDVDAWQLITKYTTGSKHHKGLPVNYFYKSEIIKAREYLDKIREKLSKDELIEYKKLGILSLNLDENSVDIDTNLPRDKFEFITTINKYGFDLQGYYYKQQEDGTYINTGLKYNPRGFKANTFHIFTHKTYDVRGFDIEGKTMYGGKYDERGFDQNGINKKTGTLYDINGYNAFGLNENVKDNNGRIPHEIRFVMDYIQNGINKGKSKDIINKYSDDFKKRYNIDINNKDTLNFLLYKASEMHTKVKEYITNQIIIYQRSIQERKTKLLELEKEKATNKELIEKLKKDNKILKQRIHLLDVNMEK